MQSTVPVAVLQSSGVLSGKTVIAVAAGELHSMALCTDGTLAAWCYNIEGQLGNNSTTQSTVPMAVLQSSGVLSGKTVVAVAAGAYHNLALCSDGTLAAWGYNYYGKLGNNSTTQSNLPVAVNTTPLATGERFITVGTGSSAYHTLALVAGPPAPKIAVIGKTSSFIMATARPARWTSPTSAASQQRAER